MDIKYYDRLLNVVGGGEVIEYIELLERENKALAKEGEEKCEKLERLEKALDKACDELSYLANETEEVMFEDGSHKTDKEFWKEWCLHG